MNTFSIFVMEIKIPIIMEITDIIKTHIQKMKLKNIQTKRQ